MNYQEAERAIGILTNEILAQRGSYIRHILLLASGLFGILIALHSGVRSDITSHYNSTPVRVLFAIAISLLALGLLLGALSLYAEVDTRTRAYQALQAELDKAKRENRAVEKTGAGRRKIFVFFEIACYVSLVLAVLCLALYSFLLVFY